LTGGASGPRGGYPGRVRRKDLPAPPPPPPGLRYPLHPRFQLLRDASGVSFLVERAPELDDLEFPGSPRGNSLRASRSGDGVAPWVALRGPHLLPLRGVVAWRQQAFRYHEPVPAWPLDLLLQTCRSRGIQPPVAVASALVVGVLRGAHAIHRACSSQSAPLRLVHRGISPSSVLVSHAGAALLSRFTPMRPWEIDGSRSPRPTVSAQDFHTIAPEQILAEPLDGGADVYACAALLWWLLTGEVPFERWRDIDSVKAILRGEIGAPSTRRPGLTPALDEVVLRGLATFPGDRYPTALAMAEALEQAAPPAAPAEVAAWATALLGPPDLLRAGVASPPGPPREPPEDSPAGHPYRGTSPQEDEHRTGGREARGGPPGWLVAVGLGVGLLAACAQLRACNAAPRGRGPAPGAMAPAYP
jgi:hypothetical protein